MAEPTRQFKRVSGIPQPALCKDCGHIFCRCLTRRQKAMQIHRKSDAERRQYKIGVPLTEGELAALKTEAEEARKKLEAAGRRVTDKKVSVAHVIRCLLFGYEL